MITIHDVAAACGVSATTVSHVLNHTRPVDPQTAARVRAAVETLGYRPLRNRDKYGLRASRTVGFFAHGAGITACADLLERLRGQVGAQCRLMLICTEQSLSDGELRAMQMFYRLSLCILHNSVRISGAGVSSDAYPVPTLLLSSQPADAPNLRCISFDYRRAAQMALSHLIGLGHTETAFLSSMHNSTVNDEIRDSVRAFLREHGLAFREDYYFELPATPGTASTQAALDSFFTSHPSLTAVIPVGAWAAACIADYFLRRELSSPRDKSIVAIGGLSILEEYSSHITRVDMGTDSLLAAIAAWIDAQGARDIPARIAPVFHPGASTRTLARTPAGAPAFAPETLELSSDELQRVRAGSFTVCVSLDNGDAAFFQLVLRGLRDALTDLNMTLLETAEAHGSLARRGSQLKYFAHLSPDAIISFSNDQTPLRDQFIALANSRSKLILGVDMPPDLPEYACASCVATNEPEKGRLAGHLLASELIRRKRRRVGFICNADVNFCARQRDLAAISTVREDFPQLEIVFRHDFLNERQAADAVRQALDAYPDVDGVYIFSARAALEAQRLLLARGRGDVLLVTTQINAEIAGMLIEYPNLLGIISSQGYEIGRCLALAAAVSLIGKQPPRYVALDPVTITAGNLERAWVRTARLSPPAQ